jgi:regulatory protein
MSGIGILPEKVLEFVAVEPAATLALPIDDEGGIHAASLVFWLDPEDSSVYFITGRKTEKCRSILKQTEVQAACVIGTTKGTPFSLQMRGRATIADPAEYSAVVEEYYRKRGNRNDDIGDPGNVLLRFAPTWLRITEYTEELEGFKKASKFDKAYNLALAYVARRVRSEWELRDYFRRKEIDDDAGEQILDRLRNYGYVNDLAFARSWVENRRLLKSISRRRLMLELRQKHVADDIVRAVFEEDETSDRDTLRDLIEKKRRQSKYQDDIKLMQYLVRQGYSYDDVKSVLRRSEDEEY